MTEATSGIVATCSSCGARYKVKDANKTYVCKKCGGEVSAANTLSEAGPDAKANSSSNTDPYAAPAARTRRPSPRQKPEPTDAQSQRRERAKASQNVTQGITIVENLLLFGIVFSGMRVLLILRLMQVFWLSGMTLDNALFLHVEFAISLVVELGVIALLVLARKNVRTHPLGLILALVIIQTITFLVAALGAIPLINLLRLPGFEWDAIVITELVLLGLTTTLTAIYWIAFRLVKRNKARFDELSDDEPERPARRRRR